MEELENKRAKTKAERLAQANGKISKRYGVEVTPELVSLDAAGWYPKLLLHYYLTLGKSHLKERDRRSLSKMSEAGGGKVFKPDVNKRLLSLEIHALEVLGMRQFFDAGAEFTNASLLEWFERINNPLTRNQVRSVLGVNIHPERDSARRDTYNLKCKVIFQLSTFLFPAWRHRGYVQRLSEWRL